ncbi:MAG: hypothetical protein ACYCXQ_14650 [Candidatus Humimicrobiaceae bacterium]
MRRFSDSFNFTVYVVAKQGFGLLPHYVRCRDADSFGCRLQVRPFESLCFNMPRHFENISISDFYLTHTKIQTLALLDDKYKGSNWYHWRMRMQPIQTISEISAQIKILPVRQVPLYQKISLKAKQLHALGMSYQQIAKKLSVGEATVIRACKYKRAIN